MRLEAIMDFHIHAGRGPVEGMVDTFLIAERYVEVVEVDGCAGKGFPGRKSHSYGECKDRMGRCAFGPSEIRRNKLSLQRGGIVFSSDSFQVSRWGMTGGAVLVEVCSSRARITNDDVQDLVIVAILRNQDRVMKKISDVSNL